jgi:hypothetical protein
MKRIPQRRAVTDIKREMPEDRKSSLDRLPDSAATVMAGKPLFLQTATPLAVHNVTGRRAMGKGSWGFVGSTPEELPLWQDDERPF